MFDDDDDEYCNNYYHFDEVMIVVVEEAVVVDLSIVTSSTKALVLRPLPLLVVHTDFVLMKYW